MTDFKDLTPILEMTHQMVTEAIIADAMIQHLKPTQLYDLETGTLVETPEDGRVYLQALGFVKCEGGELVPVENANP